VKVQGIRSLKPFIRKHEIRMAILTTPMAVSQTMTDRLVSAGIKAIWNFSPTRLTTPADVLVRNEHISLGLAQVSYHLNTLRNQESDASRTLDEPCDEPCGATGE